MTHLMTFGWGFAGSVAVEVVTLLGYYYTESARLPLRYRRPGFWITRLSLATLAGALAIGYEIDQAILAFNIGAATPLIITSLARGFRPSGSPPGFLEQRRGSSVRNAATRGDALEPAAEDPGARETGTDGS